jgi:arsenate reductase (glutaredoxin)
MIKLYGISNCDSVKKAKTWLNQADIPFEFVDFRKDGLSSEQVSRWAKAVGTELLLNKRGTTWRNLEEEQKSKTAEAELVQLMTANPTLIKRPVLESKKGIEVGFKAEQYQSLFK